MNKSSRKVTPKVIEQPRVIRSVDSIGVNIQIGLGAVTVIRHANYRIDKKPTLTWGGRPVQINWSGGNGSETVADTKEFIRALAWATRIAENLSVRDPMKLSDEHIIAHIPAGYSGVL